MPKGIPLTDDEQGRRRKEICAASVHLFLNKGFSETSMREIAQAAGVGKSTLYDYFPSKDHVLVWYVEEEISTLTAKVKDIAAEPLGAQARLERMVYAYLDYLTANEDFFTRLSAQVQRLAQDSVERIQRKRHALQDVMRQVIDEGIQEGCFRPVDSLLATRVILSALTPAVYTTRRTGSRAEMMQEAFGLLLNGLRT